VIHDVTRLTADNMAFRRDLVVSSYNFVFCKASEYPGLLSRRKVLFGDHIVIYVVFFNCVVIYMLLE